MTGFRAKLDYWLKHYWWFNRLFHFCASSTLKVLGWFNPIDNEMVLFTGHTRKYNDSPRTIYEYMIKQERFKNLKYVWGLDDLTVEIPGNPIKVKSDTLDYFKYSLRSKYWVACVNIERGLHYKKKNCLYLNTWHGAPVNAMGNQVPNRKDFDFTDVDFFCYESEWNKELDKKYLNIREESMIPSGLPRNDELYYVTPEKVDKLKEQLGLPKDKKIILYAPTWRESTDNGDTYSITPPMNIKYWEEKLGNEYILLLRTHAYTNKLMGVQFDDFCRNYTSYPRINDLFAVADILISDYSSCISDYCILERPIICFGWDYDTYKKIRGLNLDFEHEMPSGVLKTEQDVVNHILTMDYKEECQLTKDKLKMKVSAIGGHATEMCVDTLFKEYKG